MAAGAPGDPIDYALVAPPLFFIMMLPVPAASIGREQGVFILMLAPIGVPGEMAFARAVLNRLLTILSVLPGIVCIWLGLGLSPRKDVRLAVGSK